MGKMTTKKFTVRGVWPFPFDMLRFDSCWPYSSADAAKIEAMYRRDGEHQAVEIDLLTDDHNFLAPTDGRWESFGWSVLNAPA
jgi:hypothetical protein